VVFVFSGNLQLGTGNYSAMIRHHHQLREGKTLAEHRLYGVADDDDNADNRIDSGIHPSFQEDASSVHHPTVIIRNAATERGYYSTAHPSCRKHGRLLPTDFSAKIANSGGVKLWNLQNFVQFLPQA
jgi:hypothetical protein